VFPLAVARQLKNWPEAKERETHWYSAAEAAALVGNEGLSALILRLGALRSGTPRPAGDKNPKAPVAQAASKGRGRLGGMASLGKPEAEAQAASYANILPTDM
jgi:hypothetical protein